MKLILRRTARAKLTRYFIWYSDKIWIGTEMIGVLKRRSHLLVLRLKHKLKHLKYKVINVLKVTSLKKDVFWLPSCILFLHSKN